MLEPEEPEDCDCKDLGFGVNALGRGFTVNSLVELQRPQAATRVSGPQVSADASASKYVAMVCMPWGSAYKPSLAIGILKQCVRLAGFTPEVHLLNMRFAQRLGAQLYERISDVAVAHLEWFFAQLLFGPMG